MSILEKAGYKKGSDGVFAKDGKQLSFTIINIGGNSDWVAAVQVIQSELAAVGIKISPDNLSGTDFDNDVYTGNYQLAYRQRGGVARAVLRTAPASLQRQQRTHRQARGDQLGALFEPSTDSSSMTTLPRRPPRRSTPSSTSWSR